MFLFKIISYEIIILDLKKDSCCPLKNQASADSRHSTDLPSDFYFFSRLSHSLAKDAISSGAHCSMSPWTVSWVVSTAQFSMGRELKYTPH